MKLKFKLKNPQKVNGLGRSIDSVQLEGESNKATAHTRKEALAAVTVPWGLINAGFNLAICSGVETRIPLSAVTVSVRPKTKKETNKKMIINKTPVSAFWMLFHVLIQRHSALPFIMFLLR